MSFLLHWMLSVRQYFPHCALATVINKCSKWSRIIGFLYFLNFRSSFRSCWSGRKGCYISLFWGYGWSYFTQVLLRFRFCMYGLLDPEFLLYACILKLQNWISFDCRFGEDAGEVAQDTFAVGGHAMGTAWNVFKVRKTINPVSNGRLSATALKALKLQNTGKAMKAASKNLRWRSCSCLWIAPLLLYLWINPRICIEHLAAFELLIFFYICGWSFRGIRFLCIYILMYTASRMIIPLGFM